MRAIERNGESELRKKLPNPASRDNGIKTDVHVVVAGQPQQFFLTYGSWVIYPTTNIDNVDKVSCQ